MKTKISLLILIFCSSLSSPIFCQKVDFINAPNNPIAFKFKKEHFNLKGPVLRYIHDVFNKDGFLIESLNRRTTYNYIDGKLVSDSHGYKYKVNSLGYITTKIATMNIITNYKYNDKGLLIYAGNKYDYTTYTYDSNDRLIHSVDGGTNMPNFEGRDYGAHDSYVVNNETLEVFTHWTKDMTPRRKVYTNGHLTFSGISGNTHYKHKFDSYGNVIETIETGTGKPYTHTWKIEYFEDSDNDATSKIDKADLYGTWRVKRLVSNTATIENVDNIIDKEEYEPLRKALTNAKFEINANGSISLFIAHYYLQDYLIDVRWSFDEANSKIIIVDKPGGPLESEGELADITVEKRIMQ